MCVPESPWSVPPPAADDSQRIEGNDLHLFRSILLSGSKAGVLYFQYELSELATRRQIYSALVVGIMLVAMWLAVALSGRLRLLITEPIARLGDAAKAVSETRDYSIRAQKVSQDELGLLVDTFNDMLANVQRRDVELRSSEERFRTMADSSPVPIWIDDPQGGVEFLNRAYCELFGVTLEQAKASGWQPLIHPDDIAAYEGQFLEALHKRTPFQAQARIRGADGEWHWIASYGAPLFSGNGVFVGMVGSSPDITVIKRAEEERERLLAELEQRVHERTAELRLSEESLKRQAAELARSNADLEQFAYVASHDLQEPLRMVTTFMQMLANRYQGKLDSEADEFIGYAVDGATRMKQLITDLLSYSRLSTRVGEMFPTDMEAVLKDVLSNLDLAVQESKSVITHDPLPTVMSDRSQMGQLLQNLLSNAMKFSGPEPPQVHISARRSGAEWVLTVRDNGIGINPDHRDRIFVIFQRLHDRIEYPGTGIGLAICKKIVERHGGRIWVESQPGKGSSFCFTIPAATPEAGKDKGGESSRSRTTN